MSTAFDALATQASVMERVVNDLRSYHTYCTGVVSGTFEWASFIPDFIDSDPGVKKDQLYSLSTYGKSIDKLASTLRQGVLNGTDSFAAWSAYAKETRDLMAGIIQDTASWSFAGILGATAEQTGDDIASGAQTAFTWGSAGLGLGLVVVAVMALLIYGPRR